MPPFKNENQEDEKLLTGTSSEKFLPPMTAKEFLLRTPTHELHNVFGTAPEEKIPTKQSAYLTPPLPKREAFRTPDPFASLVQEEKKSRRPFFKFFVSLLVIAFVLIIVLYIYGWWLARN